MKMNIKKKTFKNNIVHSTTANFENFVYLQMFIFTKHNVYN